MSDIVKRLRDCDSLSDQELGFLCVEAADEIERLRAYAHHERSLGAEKPMIELVSAQQEIERLQTLADTRDMMLRQLRAQFDDMVHQRDRLRADLANALDREHGWMMRALDQAQS